jgi:transposase
MWGTFDARVGCERRSTVQLGEAAKRGFQTDHPLRPIRQIVDEALAELSPEFETLYAKLGRPSIPPERLLRALLLQAFYSVRSEKQLMEQLDYNLLFRWFVGLALDAQVWNETVFTKNRERLIERDIARRFMAVVLNQEPVNLIRLPKLVRAVAQPCPVICPNSTQTTKIGVATDISDGFPTT